MSDKKDKEEEIKEAKDPKDLKDQKEKERINLENIKATLSKNLKDTLTSTPDPKILNTPLGKSWNKIIEALMVAEKEWPTFAQLCSKKPFPSMEGATPEQMRAIAISTNRNKFNIGLPSLVESWRRNKGLEALLIKKGGK